MVWAGNRFIINRKTAAPRVYTFPMIWLEVRMELKNMASKPIRSMPTISMAGGQKSRMSATRLYSGVTGLRQATSMFPVMNEGIHRTMTRKAMVRYWMRKLFLKNLIIVRLDCFVTSFLAMT